LGNENGAHQSDDSHKRVKQIQNGRNQLVMFHSIAIDKLGRIWWEPQGLYPTARSGKVRLSIPLGRGEGSFQGPSAYLGQMITFDHSAQFAKKSVRYAWLEVPHIGRISQF
jgi:hypothetical protein